VRVSGKQVHQPWRLPEGNPEGCPQPLIDNSPERVEALARYDRVKAARG
jgi:deoxyribodipyrimidine photo-lyase